MSSAQLVFDGLQEAVPSTLMQGFKGKTATFSFGDSTLRSLRISVDPRRVCTDKVQLDLCHCDDQGIESETAFGGDNVCKVLQEAKLFHDMSGAQTPKGDLENEFVWPSDAEMDESDEVASVTPRSNSYEFNIHDLEHLNIMANFENRWYSGEVIYAKRKQRFIKKFDAPDFVELLRLAFGFVQNSCVVTTQKDNPQ